MCASLEDRSADDIEIVSPDPAEDLAEKLYLEFRRANSVSDREWLDLDESEREFYRTCVEGLVLDWPLVTRLHEQQIRPPITSRNRR